MDAVVKETENLDGEEKDVKPVIEELAIYLGTDEDVPIVIAPKSVLHMPIKMDVSKLVRAAMYFLEGSTGLGDFGVAQEQAVMPGEIWTNSRFVYATQARQQSTYPHVSA